MGQSPDVILVTCVRVTGTANVTGRCFDRTKGHRDTAVWATGPKEPQKEHRLHIQVVREPLAGIRVLSATPGTPRSRRPYGCGLAPGQGHGRLEAYRVIDQRRDVPRDWQA